jgi:tRNA threonylcarbamoyladenosine biosynthesis protein TsaB
MALRTWGVLRSTPIHSYLSLALVSHAQSAAEVPVIADARRDSWHVFTRAGGLRRVSAAEMTGPLITPAGFRHWSPLPADTTEVSYDLRELLPKAWRAPLLSPCLEPDAFLHEQPSYVTWTPAIHRAPAS